MRVATVQADGQRIAAVLVYYECQDGSGRTLFRDLRGEDNNRLGVSPRKGRALLFFLAMTVKKTLNIKVSSICIGKNLIDGTNFCSHLISPLFQM